MPIFRSAGEPVDLSVLHAPNAARDAFVAELDRTPVDENPEGGSEGFTIVIISNKEPPPLPARPDRDRVPVPQPAIQEITFQYSGAVPPLPGPQP
jgi:hypothetical protein